MVTYIPLLKQTALFNGVNEKETEALLQHMEAKNVVLTKEISFFMQAITSM